MKTAIINVRIDAKLKREAALVAASLGLTLSAFVNGFLRVLVKTKRFEFSDPRETTIFNKRVIKEAQKAIKRRI